jgi:ligand-binding sensor protein
MSQEFSFKTAICTEYEQLLQKCQRTLEIWRGRREEAAAANLSGKAVGDELQRLQANYAKAYSALNKHDKQCELCRFVSKIGGREPARTSSRVLEKNHAL